MAGKYGNPSVGQRLCPKFVKAGQKNSQIPILPPVNQKIKRIFFSKKEEKNEKTYRKSIYLTKYSSIIITPYRNCLY